MFQIRHTHTHTYGVACETGLYQSSLDTVNKGGMGREYS